MFLPVCAPNKVAVCAPLDAPRDSWRSYAVAFCAMILQAVVFGSLNSYPNFRDQLLADTDLNVSDNAVAWASSLSAGIAPLISIVAGQVAQTASPRVAGLISVAATALCLNLTAAFANSPASLICLFGIFMGIAVGFMISPGPAATASWFDKKITLGMGIAFAGGGVGSCVIPPIAGAMEKVMSWRDAFHLLSCFCSLSLVAALFLCIRPTSEQEEDEMQDEEEVEGGTKEGTEPVESAVVDQEVIPIVETPFNIHTHPCQGTQWLYHAFLTPRFMALFAGYAFFSFGFYAMLYAVVPFPLLMGASDTPYHAEAAISVSSASNTFIGLGVASVFGAPLFGFLSLKIGDRFSYVTSVVSLAILVSCWAACRDYWAHFLVVTLMGLCITGFFATFSSMLAQSFYGPNLNHIMGVAYAAASIGGFAGAPAITAMVNSTGNQSYTMGLLILGGSYLVSGLIVLVVIRDISTDVDPTPVAAADPQGNDQEMASNEPTALKAPEELQEGGMADNEATLPI